MELIALATIGIGSSALAIAFAWMAKRFTARPVTVEVHRERRR